MADYKIRERTRRQASPPAGMRQEWEEIQIVLGRRIISRHGTRNEADRALERLRAQEAKNGSQK